MMFLHEKLVSFIFIAVAGNALWSMDIDLESNTVQMRKEMSTSCDDLFQKYQNVCREKISTLPSRQNRAPGDETTKSVEFYINKYQRKYINECKKLLEGRKVPSNKPPYTGFWDWK